jgi:hypothetical protein
VHSNDQRVFAVRIKGVYSEDWPGLQWGLTGSTASIEGGLQ